jgi:hypothetical protein
MATIHGWFTKYFKSFRKFRQNRLGHNFAFSKKSLFSIVNISFKISRIQFAWFYFAQIVDLVYYPVLVVLKKNPNNSIDDYISYNQNFGSFIYLLIRNIFTIIQNIESTIFCKFLPGYFIYVKAIKK